MKKIYATRRCLLLFSLVLPTGIIRGEAPPASPAKGMFESLRDRAADKASGLADKAFKKAQSEAKRRLSGRDDARPLKLKRKFYEIGKPAGSTRVVVYDATLQIALGIINSTLGIGAYENDRWTGNLELSNQALPYRGDMIDVHDLMYLTLEFYEKELGWKSFDNKSSPVRVAANVGNLAKYTKNEYLNMLGLLENAAWIGGDRRDPGANGNFFVFGAGGESLAQFTGAGDVVAHEFTHAVISSTSRLKYEYQAGALNEHFADLFGEMVEHFYDLSEADFLIGDTVLTEATKLKSGARALRDMQHPERGFKKQPTHLREIPPEFGRSCRANSGNDHCGVHALSGIPNLAASSILRSFGWNTQTYRLFFHTMITLPSTATFSDYRRGLLLECRNRYTPVTCQKAAAAFKDVGIL